MHLLGGAPGGVQRGPRRGAAPNRPPLPHAGEAKSHAAQASQLRRTAKPRARRAERIKASFNRRGSKPRARRAEKTLTEQTSQPRRTAKPCARRAEKYKEVLFFAPGESLSAAFTQNRLFRPECVSAGILMLTYLSTLRSKSRRFLFRPQNAYFANSSNTSHRPRFALASLRKATPRPAFDGE